MRLRDLNVRALWPLWIAVAVFMGRALYFFASRGALGVDAHAYWLTGHHAELYAGRPTMRDAYLYSPAFAQLIWPLTKLPWLAFSVFWAAAQGVTFAWLLRPLGWPWGVPAWLLCGFEIAQGNINAFLALTLVLGFRWAGAWALPLLTKVVIGLGPVWFAARREWRQLSLSLVTTVVLAAASFLFAPHLWLDWARFLMSAGGDASVGVRVGVAVIITVVAARRDAPWLLAPAMVLACPVLHGVGQYLTICAAVPRLRLMTARPARRPVRATQAELAEELVDVTT